MENLRLIAKTGSCCLLLFFFGSFFALVPHLKPAYAAALSSVQSGTATISSGNSTTATITSVDTAKSFLVFSTRTDNANPGCVQIGGELTNSTTVTFNRNTTGVTCTNTVTILWYVASFNSGVRVQRGTEGVTGDTETINIAVVDPEKAVPIVSYTINGASYGNDDFIRTRIPTSSTVEFSHLRTGVNGGTVYWQIVEFTDSVVQSGTVSFATGDSSKTASVTAIDTTQSWLLFNYRADTGTVANIGQKMIDGTITDSTTLTFTRDQTGVVADLAWFVVEFTDDTSVQYATTAFSDAETEDDTTITSVDTTKTILTASGAHHMQGGKTAYVAADNPGPGLATLSLTSATNVRANRDLTGSVTADVSWSAITFSTTSESSSLGDFGTHTKWARSEFSLTGPDSTGASTTDNPFLIILDATFTAPSGTTYTIPGFYDGNGSGGADGSVWKIRFRANEIGSWSFTTSSNASLLDAKSGTFTVTNPTGCETYEPGDLPNFNCTGMLKHEAGSYFLKFENGRYWLKGGVDAPEYFLGTSTPSGFSSQTAAVDYLTTQKINSMYIMLQNVDGDGNNVWPWTGDTSTEAKTNHEHFNLSKLDSWDTIFDYIQSKGIVLHLVFEDDSGWTGFNRSLYYRTMVAHFGHYNGMYWNLSEEYNENYTSTQVKSYASILDLYDGFDHPKTVHGGGVANFDDFFGDSRFDLTSFQTTTAVQYSQAITSRADAKTAGRIIPIFFDETGSFATTDRTLQRQVAWSVYTGGANYEIFFPDASSYSSYENFFGDIRRARTFIEGFDYWDMAPDNSLVTSGTAYMFAETDKTYIAYLPSGGSITINLAGASGQFTSQWYNPITDTTQGTDTITGGSSQSFSAPDSDDWVLSITRYSPTTPAGPNICSKTAPLTAPNLFQVDANDTSAKLYFTPTSGQFDHYFISYGEKSDAETHGVRFDKTGVNGIVSFEIAKLKPSTTYYIKVRGGNDCIAGPWSNIMQIKTAALGSKSRMIYYSFSKTPLIYTPNSSVNLVSMGPDSFEEEALEETTLLENREGLKEEKEMEDNVGNMGTLVQENISLWTKLLTWLKNLAERILQFFRRS